MDHPLSTNSVASQSGSSDGRQSGAMTDRSVAIRRAEMEMPDPVHHHPRESGCP
jgi:hypothetical protein